MFKEKTYQSLFCKSVYLKLLPSKKRIKIPAKHLQKSFFAEIVHAIKLSTNFCKKSPSEMFDLALNTHLLHTLLLEIWCKTHHTTYETKYSRVDFLTISLEIFWRLRSSKFTRSILEYFFPCKTFTVISQVHVTILIAFRAEYHCKAHSYKILIHTLGLLQPLWASTIFT